MTNLFRFIIILLFVLRLSEAKAHEMSLDSLLTISVHNINGGLNQIYKGDPRQAMSILRSGFDRLKEYISLSSDSVTVTQIAKSVYDEKYDTITFVGYDEVQRHALNYYMANAAECIFLSELRYGGEKYMEHLRKSIEHYSFVDKVEALDIATHYTHIIDSVFSPSSIQSFMMSDIMLEHFGKIEEKDNLTMLYLQKGKKWHKNKMYSDFLYGYIPFLIRSAADAFGELSNHPTPSFDKYETGEERYQRIKLASTKNNANKTHKKERRFATYDELSYYVTELSIKAINQEESKEFREAVKTIDEAIRCLMTVFEFKLTDFEVGISLREFDRLLSLRCRFSSTLKDIDNTKKYVSVLEQIFSINDSIGIKAAMMFTGEGNHDGWRNEYAKSLHSIEKKFGKKWSAYQRACMWRAEANVLSPGSFFRKVSLENYYLAEELLNSSIIEVEKAEGHTDHYYDFLSSRMMFYILNGRDDVFPYVHIVQKLDEYLEEIKKAPNYEYHWEYISIMYMMVLHQCEKHEDWKRIKVITEKLYDLPYGEGLTTGPYKTFIDYDFFAGVDYCMTSLTPTIYAWDYSTKNTMAEYATRSYLLTDDGNYEETLVLVAQEKIQDETLRWMSYGKFYHQEHIDENLNVTARMALQCPSDSIIKRAFEYTMMCKGIQLYSMDIVDRIARQSGNREIRQLFKEYKDLYLKSLLYEKETGETNKELQSKLDDNSLFLKATELVII